MVLVDKDLYFPYISYQTIKDPALGFCEDIEGILKSLRQIYLAILTREEYDQNSEEYF